MGSRGKFSVMGETTACLHVDGTPQPIREEEPMVQG